MSKSKSAPAKEPESAAEDNVDSAVQIDITSDDQESTTSSKIDKGQSSALNRAKSSKKRVQYRFKSFIRDREKRTRKAKDLSKKLMRSAKQLTELTGSNVLAAVTYSSLKSYSWVYPDNKEMQQNALSVMAQHLKSEGIMFAKRKSATPVKRRAYVAIDESRPCTICQNAELVIGPAKYPLAKKLSCSWRNGCNEIVHTDCLGLPDVPDNFQEQWYCKLHLHILRESNRPKKPGVKGVPFVMLERS